MPQNKILTKERQKQLLDNANMMLQQGYSDADIQEMSKQFIEEYGVEEVKKKGAGEPTIQEFGNGSKPSQDTPTKPKVFGESITTGIEGIKKTLAESKQPFEQPKTKQMEPQVGGELEWQTDLTPSKMTTKGIMIEEKKDGGADFGLSKYVEQQTINTISETMGYSPIDVRRKLTEAPLAERTQFLYSVNNAINQKVEDTPTLFIDAEIGQYTQQQNKNKQIVAQLEKTKEYIGLELQKVKSEATKNINQFATINSQTEPKSYFNTFFNDGLQSLKATNPEQAKTIQNVLGKGIRLNDVYSYNAAYSGYISNINNIDKKINDLIKLVPTDEIKKKRDKIDAATNQQDYNTAIKEYEAFVAPYKNSIDELQKLSTLRDNVDSTWKNNYKTAFPEKYKLDEEQKLVNKEYEEGGIPTKAYYQLIAPIRAWLGETGESAVGFVGNSMSALGFIDKDLYINARKRFDLGITTNLQPEIIQGLSKLDNVQHREYIINKYGKDSLVYNQQTSEYEINKQSANAKEVEEYVGTGVNWDAIVPTMVKTTAQSYGFYSGGLLFGGKSALAKNVAQFGSVFVQSMDMNVQQAIDNGMSFDDAMIIGAMYSTIEGLSERIVPEEKIWGGLSKLSGSKLNKFYDDALNLHRLGMKGNVKQFATAMADLSIGYVKSVAPEIGEEFISQIGQAVTDTVYNKVNDANKGDIEVSPLDYKTLKNIALETMVGMTPTALLGGVGNMSTMKKVAMYSMGKEPQVYKDALKDLLESGQITKEKYDKQVQKVDTVSNIYEMLPNETTSGIKLNDDAKIELLNKYYAKSQLTAEKKVLENAGATEEDVKVIDEQIKEKSSEIVSVISTGKIEEDVVDDKKILYTPLQGAPITMGDVAALEKDLEDSGKTLTASEIGSKYNIGLIARQTIFDKYNNLKPKQYAVQKPTATEEMLRPKIDGASGELGLQGVEQKDQPKVITEESKTEEVVQPKIELSPIELTQEEISDLDEEQKDEYDFLLSRGESKTAKTKLEEFIKDVRAKKQQIGQPKTKEEIVADIERLNKEKEDEIREVKRTRGLIVQQTLIPEIEAKYNTQITKLEKQYEKEPTKKEDGKPLSGGVQGVRIEGEAGKESAELRAEKEEVADPLKDVESTAKALRENEDKGGKNISTSIIPKEQFDKLNDGSRGLNDIISEAYHKAKADDSNPKLVEAVEQLLGKPKEAAPQAAAIKPEIVTEKEVAETAKKTGITPKNLRDLYKINRELFGLDRIKSFASAIAMDRMVGAMAKRAGVTKEQMYGRLKFEKASEEFVKGLSAKGKVLFQLVGENAQLAQDVRDNLQVARDMETAGKDAKTIRLATGWERGADKKWRYEIEDYTQSVSDVYDLQGKSKGETIVNADTLVSKELNKLYPQLKDVSVKINIDSKNDNRGSYEYVAINNQKEPKYNQIKVYATDVAKAQSILLHEIQHAIQDIEGFARGGSPENALNILRVELIEKVKDLPKYKELTEKRETLIKQGKSIFSEEVSQVEKQRDVFLMFYAAMQTKSGSWSEAKFNAYQRLAGEAEARNVEARMGMTPEQRRATTLQETEDVAREEQIVLFDSKGIQMQVDAWHGSPYQFDKFTTEKIGTGEGAQAFGWGLYFTDLESIARGYAKPSIDNEFVLNGVNLRGKIPYNLLVDLNTLIQFRDKPELFYGELKNFEKRTIESLRKYAVESNNEELYNAFKYIDSFNDLKFNRNLYKVTLHKGKTPDQYTWLEWDKPASNVLYKLDKGLLAENIVKNSELFKGLNPKDYVDSQFVQGEVLSITDATSGSQAYKNLSRLLGGDKQASLFLLENGIDGIKYPAESISRGATSDTARGFNYVVFDENAVSIEEVIKFQKDAEKARGAMMISMDGQAVIYALTDPNVSTPLHEMAHVFEHYLTDAERVAVQNWAGTKAWTTQTSEAFARGFEKYLVEGKAPTPALQKIFEKFKQWLTDIYNGITGSDIDIELNEPMREIYAKMLGIEQPLKATPKAKKVEAIKPTEVPALKDVESTAKALEGITEKKISEKINQAYLDYAKKVQSLKDKINNLRKQEGDSDRVEKMMEDFFNMRDIERQLKTLSEQGALNMTVEETDRFLDDIKSGLGETKYKRGKIIGKNNELGDLFAAEGDGVLYRSVTLDDWERIQKQGFVDSDKRGAISEQEGTNLAIDPRTSLYYLPHNQKGVIIAIDPKGVDLFMIKNDDYLRTNSKIPISNVIKVSEIIGAGDISGKYLPSKGNKQLSEAYHKAKADGSNPELVKAVEELLGKPKEAAPQAGSIVGGTDTTLKDVDKGVPFIKKIFDKIRSATKLNKVQHNRLFNIDTKLSKEIADAYEKMKHDPNNPKVKKAYEAMVEETKQQYNALVEGGLKAERWTGEGEPYANSAEMLKDLKENNHLWFLPNESAFGDKGAATKYKDNIGLQDSGITLDGNPLTNSEVFRVVHDAVHGINGSEFGAIGEENATLQHLSMYSDEALPAVVAQTRGQNSWVNFSGVNDSANAKFKEAAKLEKEGKYDEAKKIRKEAQKEFIFAEPKIGLLPNKYNFRYYGTKNAELASKERANARSGDGNTKQSESISSFGYGKDVARESQSFSSRSNSEGRTIRTSYGDIVPKAIHTVKQSLVDGIKKAFPKSTVDKELFEIDADTFHKAATKAKSVNEFGAAVDVLSIEEYSKYRLFITEDGLTGVALSPTGDLGSGFDMSGKPRRLPQLLVLGIENGATHANAYHTILPNYYTAFGFKPVARNLWNDALKPEDWNYETFKEFNNGRPDVVHFIWDGGDRNNIHERIGQFDNYNKYYKEQTPIIDTWEEAQEIVAQFLQATPQAGSVVGSENPALKDVESTAKALGGVDEANMAKIILPETQVKQKVYHGGESKIVGDFKNLNPNLTGFYFSSDIDNAKTYGNEIVEAYVDIKNPLIIDAKGLKFTDDIPVEAVFTYPNEKPYTAIINLPIDDVVYAVKNGKRPNQFFEIKNREKYDGVIFKNLIDPALTSRREIPQDTIVAFENSQIKRADNKSISESYHKAKADGSNPELVKAVEELLGKPKEAAPQAGSRVGDMKEDISQEEDIMQVFEDIAKIDNEMEGKNAKELKELKQERKDILNNNPKSKFIIEKLPELRKMLKFEQQGKCR